ncbi:MAG: hypothetical protein GY739_00210 [Mesoflavibacter sp.]|nr:hypothetical protein [Mesoflavibacter sp.]
MSDPDNPKDDDSYSDTKSDTSENPDTSDDITYDAISTEENMAHQNNALVTTATVHSAMHGVTQSSNQGPKLDRAREQSFNDIQLATAPYATIDNAQSESGSDHSLPGNKDEPAYLEPLPQHSEKDKDFKTFLDFKRFIENSNRVRENERKEKKEKPKKTRSRSNSIKRGRENERKSKKGRSRRTRSSSSSSNDSVKTEFSTKVYHYEKRGESLHDLDKLADIMIRKMEKRGDSGFANKDINKILDKVPSTLERGPLDIDRVQRHAKKLGKYPTLFTKQSNPTAFFANFMYLEERSPPFSHLSYIALVKQFFSNSVLEAMNKHSIQICDFDDAKNFVYTVVDVVSNKLLNANDYQIQLDRYLFTSSDFENPKDCIGNLCALASQTGLNPKLQALKVLDKLCKYYLPNELKPVALTLKSNPKLDLNIIKTFANDFYYDIVQLNGKRDKVGVKQVQPLAIAHHSTPEDTFSTESVKSYEKQGAIGKKLGKKDKNLTKDSKHQTDAMENVLSEIKKLGSNNPPPQDIDYNKIVSMITKHPNIKAIQEGGVKGGPCTYCGGKTHPSERCIKHPDERIRAENQKQFDKIMADRNRNNNSTRGPRKQCILCLAPDHYSSNCGYYPRITPVQESCPICEAQGMPHRKHPVAACLLNKKN